MIIFKHPADIEAFLSIKKTNGTTVGFVPTMGALHSGHIALVTNAKQENQLTVCSIFVNPTQFNDPKDFEKYPSTIEKDIWLLEKAGCDVIFMPSVKDIYPNDIKSPRHYDLGYLENILEGKYRPGHFQGVCQVVNRLLDIVTPGKLYLGQKDYQQCMVITKMIKLLGINTAIVVCDTLREADGLAMSSRNLRLNEKQRKKAVAIYNTLLFIKTNIVAGDTGQLSLQARQLLTAAGFNVDYVAIANAATLEIIQTWDGKLPLVALTAAYLEEVRLIDNMLLTESKADLFKGHGNIGN